MIATEIVNKLNKALNLDNRQDSDSHYIHTERGTDKYLKLINIRVSDHNTFLTTWVRSCYCLDSSENVCIVFMDNYEAPNKSQSQYTGDVYDHPNWRYAFSDYNEDGDFEVMTYIYDAHKIEDVEYRLIKSNLSGYIDGRLSKFVDPLKDDRDKKAKVFKLHPNKKPFEIRENINGSALETYLCNIIMDMYAEMIINNSKQQENQKCLVTGAKQSLNINESYVIKSPELINIYS